VPENVRVEQYIPFSRLLPRCDAMISHAGYGTVMAGLCNGLPMLLLPLGADQPLHAARCEALGAATVIERGALSEGAIREGLGRLLGDRSLRDRAGDVRQAIEAMPGMARGCGSGGSWARGRRRSGCP
jgi:UDP:flavonoid glycosyltransferase YjiC (YdhE family)